MKAITPAERPVQEVTDSETRAEAFMDGEKTGFLLRASATMLDKLYLHSPLTSIDTHISVAQHITPSRMFLGTVAALSARNAYRRFRYRASGAFEREMELEELREMEAIGEAGPSEHISKEMSLHETA